MSIYARLVLIVFSTILLLPNITFFTADRDELREYHKRELADLPAAVLWRTQQHEAVQGWRDWYQDRLGLTMFATKQLGQIRFFLLGGNAASNIFRTGGRIFISDPAVIATGQHPACLEEEEWDDLTVTVTAWLETNAELSRKTNVPIDFVIPVTTPVLFADNLPDSWPQKLKNSCLSNQQKENPFQAIAQSGYSVTYARDAFLNQLPDPAFYPDHNFHFDGLSALVNGRQYLSSIGKDTTILDRLASDKKSVEIESDISYMARFQIPGRKYKIPYETFGLREVVPRLATSEQEFAVPLASITSLYPTGRAKYWQNTSPEADGRLLILGNSFGAYAAPAMATGFEETMEVNISNLHSSRRMALLSKLMESFSPDRVALVFHDGGVMSSAPVMTLGDGDVFEDEEALALALREQRFCYGEGFRVPGTGCVVRWEWSAKDLPGLVGELNRTKRVSTRDDGKGVLSFGPNIGLAEGEYRFAIEIDQFADDNLALVSRWDLAAREVEGGPLKQLLVGDIPRTKAIFDRTFELHQDYYDFQVRTYAMGTGRLELHGISIEKVGTD